MEALGAAWEVREYAAYAHLRNKAFDIYRARGADNLCEKSVQSFCCILCARPDVWASMGWPTVIDMEAEYATGPCLIDIILFHSDRSATAVEVKRGGLSVRDLCTGLGQLLVQRLALVKTEEFTEVRMVLVTEDMPPAAIIEAAYSVGIDLMPICNHAQWQQFLKEGRDEKADA